VDSPLDRILPLSNKDIHMFDSDYIFFEINQINLTRKQLQMEETKKINKK
jgi:hypothetical protein